MNSLSICLSILWLYLWVNYERTLDEWLRHIVGILWTNLWKKPKGFFKQWLKGILVGFLWSNSQFAHRVYWDQSGGLFLNKLSLYPLGFLRVKWKGKCLRKECRIGRNKSWKITCPDKYTQWANWEFDQRKPTYIPLSHSLKKPLSFFHKFDQNMPTICLSHSPKVLS